MDKLAAFISDSLKNWEFWAVVVTLALWLLDRWRRDRKKLTYDILTNAPVVSVQKDVRQDIRVLYKDQPVAAVNLFVLRLANEGNTDFAKQDFEEPITFKAADGDRILAAEVVKVDPPNLKPTLMYTEADATLAPMLLNHGESVTLKFVTSGAGQELTVAGRIKGVSRIKRKVPEGNAAPQIRSVGLGMFLVSVVVVMTGMAELGDAAVLVGFGLVLLLISAFTPDVEDYSRRMWKRWRPKQAKA
jgi:hypothetical protein